MVRSYTTLLSSIILAAACSNEVSLDDYPYGLWKGPHGYHINIDIDTYKVCKEEHCHEGSVYVSSVDEVVLVDFLKADIGAELSSRNELSARFPDHPGAYVLERNVSSPRLLARKCNDNPCHSMGTRRGRRMFFEYRGRV